ncbi:hypothetical protein [Luteolibacter soli]|uniref:HEAT repeat domain-containing protein n=1 Tax=Luteolibacter soli TaxID=3135280 RepID=A0ABU9AVW7_9BACT
MKASLFASLVILIAGGLLGWKQHGQLVTVRESHRLVEEEARALGLNPEALLTEGKPPLPTKSTREDPGAKIAEAKSFAKELIAFGKKMKEQEKSGEPPDEKLQKEIMETLRRFMDLSPTQIKAVIAELKDSQDLDDDMRRGIVGFSIMMLANDQPEAAIAIYTESSDMKGLEEMGPHVIASALGKWSEKDPVAAMEWVKKNAEKYPNLVTEDTKTAILAGAAKQDPKLAIGMADDLGLKEQSRVANGLASSARTSEERNALLQTLRAEKDKADLTKTTLMSLGGQLTNEGFESSQAWLSSAKLSKEETQSIAQGISSWQAGADTGKWIEWMDGKVPDDTLTQKTDEMVRQWTRNDYKSAGEWIGTLKDGAAKDSAIKSFAKTVAPYEPEAALQWANSLPEGKERDQLLEQIRNTKPEKGK